MDEKIKNTKISVIGAGSWGTAIANLLALKGFHINLWSYEEDVCIGINTKNENEAYLPGIKLSKKINATTSIEEALNNKNLVVMVVPSHVMRDVCIKIAPYANENMVFISASKGIENESFKTMSTIIQETISASSKTKIGVLSGPSFAKELSMLKPTVVTIASEDMYTATYLQQVFASSYFRVYTSDDILGVEIGGAVKNVIAIASGIVDGMGYGLNTRAALITRGLAEIRRIGVALGANPHTFSGLSGVGDLILTCTGNLSRNHTVGEKLGQGKKLDDILKEMRMVAEGIKTAKSVYYLGKKLEIDLPICEEVYKIIYENKKPELSGNALMTRSLKQEIDFDIY